MNPLRFRLDFVNDPLDIGRIGDVGGIAVGRSTGIADRLQRRLQALQGARNTGHRRSAGGQLDRDRPADASRCARHQRNLPRQIDATARGSCARSLGHDRHILGDWSRPLNAGRQSARSRPNSSQTRTALQHKISRMLVIIRAVDRQQPQKPAAQLRPGVSPICPILPGFSPHISCVGRRCDGSQRRSSHLPFYRAGMLVHGVLRSMRLSSPVRTRPGPIS